MGLGCEWRHARKRGAEKLVISKKDVSWDLTLGRAIPARGLTVGDVGTVRRVKIVSLSLFSCWKTKNQEANKRFVPEKRRVVSVSYFVCICIFV